MLQLQLSPGLLLKQAQRINDGCVTIINAHTIVISQEMDKPPGDPPQSDPPAPRPPDGNVDNPSRTEEDS